MIDVEKISEFSHVLLVADNTSFANASVLYSYILTLHKKVSLQNSTELDVKFSFLPWFDKSRTVVASSAELVINVGSDSKKLYEELQSKHIKINQKMATSLYCGLFLQFDGFSSNRADGTTFAIVSELIALKAEYKKCNLYLRRREPLSRFRLRAILFKNLLLVNDAQEAEIELSDDDLSASGATLEDAFIVMQEALNIVNVRKVTLIKCDENRKILKIVKEI